MPVEIEQPNSSSTSSTRSRREIRFLTDRVAILEPWPERPRGDAGGQLGAGLATAAGAAQTLQPVLDQLDRDRRQLADLVADGIPVRLAFVLGERMPAGAALGPVLDQPINLRERLQRPAMPGMARLPTLLSPRAGRALARRRARRIVAGRKRGVLRVATQPPLELLHPCCQPRDLRVLRLDPRRQREQHRDDGLASLRVDRLRLGPLHTAQFAGLNGVPSNLQTVKPSYFAASPPIPSGARQGSSGAQVRGTERLQSRRPDSNRGPLHYE